MLLIILFLDHDELNSQQSRARVAHCPSLKYKYQPLWSFKEGLKGLLKYQIGNRIDGFKTATSAGRLIFFLKKAF